MAVSRLFKAAMAAFLSMAVMPGGAMAAGENASGTLRFEFGAGAGRPELKAVKQVMNEDLNFLSGFDNFAITTDPLKDKRSTGPVGSLRFGGMLSNNFGLGLILMAGSAKITAEGTYTNQVWDYYYGWWDDNDYTVTNELSNSYAGGMIQLWLEGGKIPGVRFHVGAAGGLAKVTSEYHHTRVSDTDSSSDNEYTITYDGTAPALLAEAGLDFWITRNFALCFNAGYLNCKAEELKTTGESTGDVSSITAGQTLVDNNGNTLVYDLSGPQFTFSLKFGFGYSDGAQAAQAARPQPTQYAAEPPRQRVQLAPGEKVKNIAVSTLDAQNVSAGDAAVIADLLRSELVKSGAFNVVEKANMDKILTEQGFQQSGCTSEECAVKLGKLLNVHRMIVGSFGKLMGRYFINLRVVDVETGQVIFSDKAKGDTVDDIEAGVAQVSDSIAREAR